MAKDDSISDGAQKFGKRPVRAWRSWGWSIASWLGNGGIAVAFYLAARTGAAGILALAAFVSSFLLRQVLEATSQGD